MTKNLKKQDNRLDIHYESILGDISNVIDIAKRIRQTNSLDNVDRIESAKLPDTV